VVYLGRSGRALEGSSSDRVSIQPLGEQPGAEKASFFLGEEWARIYGFQLLSCGTCHVLQVSNYKSTRQPRNIDQVRDKGCFSRTFYQMRTWAGARSPLSDRTINTSSTACISTELAIPCGRPAEARARPWCNVW